MSLRQEAYREYVARQRGESEPIGKLVPTPGKITRWIPGAGEVQPCCAGLSNNSPSSMKEHCCSARHIANIFGIDPNSFSTYVTRKHIRETKKARKRSLVGQYR